MKIFCRIIIVLIISALSACTTIVPNQAPLDQVMSWPQRQAQLTQMTQWQVQGAVAIRTEAQAQTASVALTQNQQQFELQIFGPMGIGRNVLTGDPTQVTLQTGSGQTYHAQDAEALLQKQFGWTLPVSNLYYWLRGLPAPQTAAQLQFDRYHHLIKLQQQDWSITYVRYVSDRGIDLPSKIIMQRLDLRVLLVINEWQI